MKRSHAVGALLLCFPLGIAVAAAQSSSQGAGDRSASAAHHALTQQ
jgi:hypothetical protein